MPKKCCIPNCRLQSDDPGCLKLHFLQVPSNENTRKKWSDQIKNYFNQEVNFKKYTYVCALHFERNCFYYSGLCKNLRLKKESCPTIFEYTEEDEENSADSSDNHTAESTNNFLPTTEKSVYNNIIIQLPTYSNADKSNTCSDFADEQIDGTKKMNERYQNIDNKLQMIQKKIVNESLANIDLDTLDYDNKSLIRKLFENAQIEIRTLYKNRRNQSMKLYLTRRELKKSRLLISYARDCKFKSNKVVDQRTKSFLREKVSNESNSISRVDKLKVC